MNRDRLDKFLNALEQSLVDLTRSNPSLDVCSPNELLTCILGCIIQAHEQVSKGPEGTRILVGPGHVRHGRYGTVMTTAPGPPACYEVQLEGVPGTVLVPQGMCLPATTPTPESGARHETVTEMYARVKAQESES